MSEPDKPKTDQPFQCEVTVVGQWAALAQVAEASNLSRDALLDAAEKGAVWWRKSAGKGHRKPVRIRSLDAVSAGDQVLVNYDASVLALSPAAPVLIAAEKNYSVWHKPAGLLSQGSKWSDHCTVTRQVELLHMRNTFLVHRLDRAASGLIIIAHTKNAVAALARLFAEREVEKTYRAQVEGPFSKGVPLVIDDPVDGKSAHTEILHAEPVSGSDRSELTIRIKTGRKHQIRSHLASLGCPVVGDRLFNPDADHTEDLQLLASELRFTCPFTNKQCHYVATAQAGR